MFLLDGDARHPAAARMIGPGALYALTPGKGIVAHREPRGVLHAYVTLTRSLEWFDSVDFADPKAAKTRLAAEFEGWTPDLTALIVDSDTAPVLRNIYALPIGHRWQRVSGVTLLGDAAHLAPPDGEGANLAMLDGAELGKAIAEHRDNIHAALIEYEEAMFARSATSAVEAAKMFKLCFQDDNVPYGLIELFTGGSAPA
jgi:2-polyprenyl-6-methoxyphenol hydroxylase-like FAD-dependent oxidoreductase